MKVTTVVKWLVSVMVMAMLAVVALAGASNAAVTMCQQYARAAVTSYGVTYNIQNDNFGGHPECLTLYGNSPAFRVASSFWITKLGNVQAFPDITTVKSSLPMQIWALRNTAKVSWSYTTNHAPGAWNAAIEMWTNTQRTVVSHPNGAEIMIWLNKTSNIYKTTPKKIVRIDGVKWYLTTWRVNSAVPWNYVQFRRVHPIATVKALPLAPFFWATEKAGLLSNQWYLESIGAGFEIWNGGRGLSTTSFRATV